MKLKLIGYWGGSYEEDINYPSPVMSEDFWTEVQEKHPGRLKEFYAKYLDNGLVCNSFRGSAGCRICGKTLGSHERHDGVYIWPDGLSHYILEHNVILPMYFIDHIANSSSQPLIEHDTEEWIEWGDRQILHRRVFI